MERLWNGLQGRGEDGCMVLIVYRVVLVMSECCQHHFNAKSEQQTGNGVYLSCSENNCLVLIV